MIQRKQVSPHEQPQLAKPEVHPAQCLALAVVGEAQKTVQEQGKLIEKAPLNTQSTFLGDLQLKSLCLVCK